MDTIHTEKNLPIYRLGKMSDERFWIERPDGRMFQINFDTKVVLKRLAAGEQVSAISEDLQYNNEDILLLLDMLNLENEKKFLLVDEQDRYPASAEVAATSTSETVHFYNPWIERRSFTWAMSGVIAFSIICIILFIKQTPLSFVSSLTDQWIVAGALTFSVLIHEIGHLLAMPKNPNLSINVEWSGPIPLLNIVCNEAWKLPKQKRIRINGAGFIADLLIAGIAAAMGLFYVDLSPWIWTFLIVHLFRTIFAILPLLPGDGYWMLVDLFDQPNLWINAMQQVRQLKMSWLSLYAVARMMFLLFIWFLYAYIIYMWSGIIFSKPFEEALVFFLHPAPLLITLNLLNQLVAVSTFVFKRLSKTRMCLFLIAMCGAAAMF